MDDHVFNPFRGETPVATDLLSQDEYKSNYTVARLVEAAYRLGKFSREPVTVVSADDIDRYAKWFAGHERLDDTWEYLKVGFIRPQGVKDISV